MKNYSILLVILLTSILINLFYRYQFQQLSTQINELKKERQSLDNLLSSYYLMRISLVYTGSKETNYQLKKRSYRLIKNEITTQDNIILHLKHNKENSLFIKMMNNYYTIRQLTENSLTSKVNDQINIIFNEIPEKRNNFRISTENYFRYFDNQIETTNNQIIKTKNVESASFYIFIFLSFLNSLLFLKKQR